MSSNMYKMRFYQLIKGYLKVFRIVFFHNIFLYYVKFNEDLKYKLNTNDESW